MPQDVKLELVVFNKQDGLLQTNIEVLEKFVKEKLENYKPELYMGDSDAAKKDRAELNSSVKVLTQARISLMKEIMSPFEDFDTRCKALEKEISKASKALDEIVKVKENQERNEREVEVRKLWEKKNFDLLSFEKVLNPKWLNKTAKRFEIEKEMDNLIAKVYKELKTIERFADDYETVKAVYLDCLDISEAIELGEKLAANRKLVQKEVETREERETVAKMGEMQKELNQDRIANNEAAAMQDIVAEALGFSVEEKEEVKKEVVKEFVLSFKATDKQCFALRQWLIDNKIVYDSIKELSF